VRGESQCSKDEGVATRRMRTMTMGTESALLVLQRTSKSEFDMIKASLKKELEAYGSLERIQTTE
jgi:hypothetical protein